MASFTLLTRVISLATGLVLGNIRVLMVTYHTWVIASQVGISSLTRYIFHTSNLFQLNFTLRSWLHRILTGIKFCRQDFRTTYIKMLFRQFCNINIYVKIVCIIILQSRRQDTKKNTMWQICPLLSTRIRTLSPGLEKNNALKCCFCIFPTTLAYAFILEIFFNPILM